MMMVRVLLIHTIDVERPTRVGHHVNTMLDRRKRRSKWLMLCVMIVEWTPCDTTKISQGLDHEKGLEKL
jgi:hypothetical protein